MYCFSQVLTFIYQNKPSNLQNIHMQREKSPSEQIKEILFLAYVKNFRIIEEEKRFIPSYRVAFSQVLE